MHIVMVSDHETHGGAAIAASRLALGLLKSGHRVTRLVGHRDADPHPWTTVPIHPRHRYVALTRALPGEEFGDRALRRLLNRDLARSLDELEPDVLNLHNLHGAADLGWSAEMASVADGAAPTLWTLHDMWSFTGRCAYSYDCDRYLTGCDAACPTPHEYPSLAPDRIAGEWRLRRDTIASLDRTLAVAPSRWLAERASDGLWGSSQVRRIPYGLPLDVFRPRNKTSSRDALGLPRGVPVLLAVADALEVRRKGMSLLLESCRLLQRPVVLLTLGRGAPQVEADHVQTINLGHVASERLKAVVYNAADLLVHPALADNLPLVVQEAIACGTPVAAFSVGGLPDLVRPGETGWLANRVEARELARTIENGLERDRDLSDTCRAVAESEWSLRLQAERYETLAKSIVGRRGHEHAREASASGA